MRLSHTKLSFTAGTRGETFTLANMPPHIPFSQEINGKRLQSLREWSAPIDDTDDDVATTENLPDFESTNLDYLYLLARPSLSDKKETEDLQSSSQHAGRAPGGILSVTSDVDQPPAKKRRIDNSLLHTIVPQVCIIVIA